VTEIVTWWLAHLLHISGRRFRIVFRRPTLLIGLWDLVLRQYHSVLHG